MESLNSLVIKLHDAKQKESAAKDVRVDLENQIAAHVDTPDNGSRTVEAGNGIKVTVKRAIGYKADVDAIRASDIPDVVKPLNLTDPKPAEYVFDPKKYEALRAHHPDLAAKLADCVVATPRKPSVSMKLA